MLVASSRVPLKFTRWAVVKVGLKNKSGYPLDFQARCLKTKKTRKLSPFDWEVKVLTPALEIQPELRRRMAENPHLVLVRHVANAGYCSHELFDVSTWEKVRLERVETNTAEFTIEGGEGGRRVRVRDDDLEDSQTSYTSTMTPGLRNWLKDNAED